MEVVTDLVAGKIIVRPIGPAPSAQKQSMGTEDVDADVAPKEKVARPPNSFIIYRQKWHPKVVKEHPGMHNNDICKSFQYYSHWDGS